MRLDTEQFDRTETAIAGHMRRPEGVLSGHVSSGRLIMGPKVVAKIALHDIQKMVAKTEEGYPLYIAKLKLGSSFRLPLTSARIKAILTAPSGRPSIA